MPYGLVQISSANLLAATSLYHVIAYRVLTAATWPTHYYPATFIGIVAFLSRRSSDLLLNPPPPPVEPADPPQHIMALWQKLTL